MSRRKLSFPILSASNDVLNKDYIKNNIEDLTKGEVVLNISGDNSTMLFFDENENLAIFESSVLVDKKIEKIIEEVNFCENKEVLDGITEEKVAAWDAAESNAKADAEAKYQVKGDYESAGAAAQALVDAKAYTDGKVDGKFDEVGAAAQALADAKADAEAKYQVKGDYEAEGAAAQALVDAKAYVDGKVDGKFDEVGAAAQALADAKADAEAKYQVKGEYEAAGAAATVEGKLDAHKEDAVMHITEAERTDWNAAKSAIDAFLKDADMTEKAVDTLAELQTYMTTDGEAAAKLIDRVSALEEIDHNAYVAADTQVLVDAKTYVDGKVDGKFDAVGSAAAAEAAAKSDAAAKYQVKGNYETAGAAAAAEAAAKSDAAAKYQVKGNYETAGAAAAAEAAAKSDAAEKYQVKGNYETAGAAAAAKNEAIASAKTWVEDQDYVTSTELNNKKYATETWVENKKYLTSVPTEYVTETELTNKGYATQTWVEGKKYLTSHQDISGKQDVISDLEAIRSGAAKGATALQSVPAEYVTETELTNKGYLTEHQDISGKQDIITDLETIRSGAAKGASALQSIGLSKVSLKAYLLGSAIKEGAVSALATSTDDIYMEDGELYATSDERLKDFGDNISVDLDKLSEIPKAYYTWKTNPQGRKMIGLSAQKIGALHPEVVSTDENGKMAVSYEKLSVIALAAIDELHKENEELKHRLKRIEEKLGL